MCCFCSARYELCKFVLTQRGAVRLLLVSVVCVVQELFGTSGACCFPCCCDSSSCTRDCVFPCLIMEARLVVLENRLRQMEEVLVMGRLARWFAESAQQMVGTQSAGVERSLGATSLVGARETGEPPTSSGEGGLIGRAEGMTWHLWSFILWSCLGAFEQMVIGSSGNVVARERDPAVTDKVIMMGRKRRFSIHLYCVIVLTCRRRASLAVRRLFSFGFEAWKQLCRELSSLTNQTCSREARRRCVILLAMRYPNTSEQCLELRNARTCHRAARAETARRARTKARVSRQRNRRNASVV